MDTGEVKKAIKELEGRIEIANAYLPGNSEWPESLKTALEALEKQIPKKLEIRTTTSSNGIPITLAKCQVCGIICERRDYYCQNCGQALEWPEAWNE